MIRCSLSFFPAVLLLLGLVVFFQNGVWGLSPTIATTTTLSLTRQQQQVSFPFKSSSSLNTAQDNIQFLKQSFQDVVDSSDEFFVQSTQYQRDNSICNVPVLGSNIEVSFRCCNNDVYSTETEFVLNVNDECGLDEFGWICVKFYENKEIFENVVDTSNLYNTVLNHFNKQPPHPGFDAATSTVKNSFVASSSSHHQIDDDLLFHGDKATTTAMMMMNELETNGFVILDNGPPKSTQHGNELLTQFLTQKTNQANHVRTDTVHFLNRNEAVSCGFENHYDYLMGIASYLNTNLNFDESPYEPMYPATYDNPLTIPNTVQLAEYGYNDFYKAHSDNSLTDRYYNNNDNTRIRSNFRHYTCILYCNDDDWSKDDDGGALRLYPKTDHLLHADDAIKLNYPYIDIEPKNGKLIIFNSCYIHSVEKVTSKTKKRRALTLWINRPNHSGIEGEKFF